MGRILGFDMQTLIQMGIVLFNVLLLCFVLYKLMYKSVQKFLKDREDKIAKQIDDTKNNLKNAEDLMVEYEQKLIDIEKEREEIIEAAKKRGLDKEFQIIQEAKKEAQLIKERASTEIEREYQKARDEMKKEIFELSAIIASRFISKSMDEQTQNKLLNDAIADLRDVKWLA